MIETSRQEGGEPESARRERAAHVFVESWPAGGWAIWVEGHPAPVSRHDTEEEAQFRAAAYRRGIARGQRLAFGGPPPGRSGPQLDREDEQLVDLVRDVLVDPNLHTDLRMRLQEEIAELLHATRQGLSPVPQAEATAAPAHARAEHLPRLLGAVLVDPNLHTDARLRLHRQISELVDRRTR